MSRTDAETSSESVAQRDESFLIVGIGASAGGILLLEQQLKETEAVLLHHRGEAHQLLGNEKEAKDDIAEAEQLGYDPANGVF